MRAKKLVPGQLGACIKLALIRPAWYVHESWLSYDQLGTCKTAGPLGQLGACIKLAVIRPARYVRESWLWPAWYVQNSWSSWPTRYVQKVGPGPTRCVHKVGSYQTSSVRAKKLVILWPAWYVQNSWSSWPTRCVHKVGCFKANSVRAKGWLFSWYLGFQSHSSRASAWTERVCFAGPWNDLLTSWWYSAFRRLGAMFVGRHPAHQIGSCGTEKCLKGVLVERLSGCEKDVFIAAHLRNPFQGKYQPLVPPHHCLVF